MTDSEFDEGMYRMRSGDREPLKTIYQDYIGFIYSTVFSVVGNKENAEDITADFFIKIWEQADKYKPGTGHKAWMSRIAHNMAVDFLRKRKRETLTDEMSRLPMRITQRAVSRSTTHRWSIPWRTRLSPI